MKEEEEEEKLHLVRCMKGEEKGEERKGTGREVREIKVPSGGE